MSTIFSNIFLIIIIKGAVLNILYAPSPHTQTLTWICHWHNIRGFLFYFFKDADMVRTLILW